MTCWLGTKGATAPNWQAKRTREGKALAALQVEKTAIAGERHMLRPILRYLATLLSQADEVVLQWFILVVALLLDPAAVLLLLGAARTRS